MSEMSQITLEPTGRALLPARAGFIRTALGIASLAALLAGWMPLRFSIVTVFLFAGPHNWLEFRYFLTRLPARWGRLRGFFLFSFTGILGLTAAYVFMVWQLKPSSDNADLFRVLYPLWNTLLVLWIAGLV